MSLLHVFYYVTGPSGRRRDTHTRYLGKRTERDCSDDDEDDDEDNVPPQPQKLCKIPRIYKI